MGSILVTAAGPSKFALPILAFGLRSLLYILGHLLWSGG